MKQSPIPTANLPFPHMEIQLDWYSEWRRHQSEGQKLVPKLLSTTRRRGLSLLAGYVSFQRYDRILIVQTQPLSYAFGAFSQQIRKPVDEIIFTNQGVRIFSKFLTPQRLGLDYEAEFGKLVTILYE